jgi:acetyl/propionyl-CoA carboxylase alpha subunit
VLRFQYRVGDQVYTVELERTADNAWRAVVNGHESHVAVEQTADGGWRLFLHDKHASGYVAHEQERRHVWLDGRQHTLEVVNAGGRRRAHSGGGENRLMAQMPGVVRAVQVAAGDVVTRGQLLVVLEAMKMELRVTAPDDGVVTQVAVAVGVVVERGAVLVELSPRD